MRDSTETQTLAIDGGGTRCRIALQDAGERLVSEFGPANTATDFDNAVRCLLDGLNATAQNADMSFDTLCALPAFVGLAGITGKAEAKRMANALPLKNARYADDRRAALRGALGRRDGLIAHCGTGSFFASRIAGDEQFAGGWGARLGDEASAQWVGRKALAKVLQHHDGFVASSPMIEDLQSRFGDTGSLVSFAQDASPAALGALAPCVTQHAQQGDVVAVSILQSAGDHIASSLRQMAWKPGLAICLTGGIGPFFAPYLAHEMAQDLIDPLGEPLDGAIALSQEIEVTHGYC
ncbi:BadF/BadG/BcrA/BcrD ATPase family protein [Thalassococcus lentus]|uniref:ATPase n=1 Tax=Thalassococcus lentus TaxID=1210524 RepID=A0ABT4XUJ4_9RHOB|nr:BadF/BadG/BcrA/BcrD ATPase family protein [Thalassococcus lentus]MDA7425648.1 ATPase [Thalassococcus lentus]